MRNDHNNFPHDGHWLYSLVVKTHYRGMGIGSSLTEKVIKESISEWAEELFLLVFENNLPAIKMYSKLGFEQVPLPIVDEALVDDVEKYGRRRLTMRKTLC